MIPRPSKVVTPQDPVEQLPRETTDPRKAPPGSPIALPQEGVPYPQEGVPYLDPDQVPDLDLDALQVLALDPGEAVIGSPDFTIRVLGVGFDAGTVILWNGSPEPTTYVSPTEVTTGVNMATVSGPFTVTVGVRTAAGVESNSLAFTFVAAP